MTSEEPKLAAISYQVSAEGEISVIYGPGHEATIPKEALVAVPLRVPQELKEAIEDAMQPDGEWEVDFVVTVRKPGQKMMLRRCHCHAGDCHCH